MFKFLKTNAVDIGEKELICPKCNISMSKKIYGEIILDVCKNCGGSWFDKEEVEKYIKQKNQYNLY